MLTPTFFDNFGVPKLLKMDSGILSTQPEKLSGLCFMIYLCKVRFPSFLSTDEISIIARIGRDRRLMAKGEFGIVSKKVNTYTNCRMT